jgi:hypothetical protein
MRERRGHVSHVSAGSLLGIALRSELLLNIDFQVAASGVGDALLAATIAYDSAIIVPAGAHVAYLLPAGPLLAPMTPGTSSATRGSG